MLRAELHDAVHSGQSGDLEFYRNRCAEARSVLELGCGGGRMIGALAERCERALGLELDQERLALARETFESAPATLDGRLTFVHGDMRSFELDEAFDRIIIPHGGLYCLLEAAEVVACLTRAARHLAPRGRVVFDGYLADEFHRSSQPDDICDDEFVPVKSVEVGGTEWDVLERSRWDRDLQRIDAAYVHVPHHGGDPIEIVVPQRYILAEQVPSLLAQAGLRAITVAAAFPQAPAGEKALVVEAALAKDAP